MSNGNCHPSIDPCDIEYQFDVGDQRRLNMLFTDQQTQLPTDPDTVSITITEPDGTATTYNYGDPGGEITRSAEGQYHFQLLFTQSGAYHYRWVSTGHGAGAYENYLGVKQPGPTVCDEEAQREAAWDEAADTPKRTRGDQGEIEERSADDKIKLDQYNRKRKSSRFDIARQSTMSSGKYPTCR